MIFSPMLSKACSTSNCLDGPVLRQDLREQLAQAWDVPLAVAELVDQAPLGLCAIDLNAS